MDRGDRLYVGAVAGCYVCPCLGLVIDLAVSSLQLQGLDSVIAATFMICFFGCHGLFLSGLMSLANRNGKPIPRSVIVAIVFSSLPVLVLWGPVLVMSLIRVWVPNQ